MKDLRAKRWAKEQRRRRERKSGLLMAKQMIKGTSTFQVLTKAARDGRLATMLNPKEEA